MSETLVPNLNLLVAHMTVNGTHWTQTIHAKKVGGGDLTATDDAPLAFFDFCKFNTPNAGTVDTLSCYKVYQRVIGTTNVEHPPVFTTTLNANGTHDANYNGSPIGSPLPKDVAVYARCATSGGRSGKLFIRNLLEESDVDSVVSGSWEFTSGSTRFTVARFATVVTDSLAACFPGGSGSSNSLFQVAHLLLVKSTDTRSAFSTDMTGVTAIRPVWNRAHR